MNLLVGSSPSTAIFSQRFCWLIAFIRVRRRIATRYGGQLRRFFKMAIGRLQVVLLSDLWAIPHPAADYVSRELFFQFRLAAGTSILKQLWPLMQSGPVDDLSESIRELF